MVSLLKRFVFFLLIAVTAVYTVLQLPVKPWAKDAITDYFAQRGVIIANMEIEAISPLGIEVTHVEVVSPSHYSVGAIRAEVLRNRYELQNLVIPRLLDATTDATFNVVARIGESGGRLGFVGDAQGQPQDMTAQFALIPARKGESPKVHIDNASMRWQGALISVQNTDFSMPQLAPVEFALQVSELPLDMLLKMALGPQTVVTGAVSGTIPLEYALGQTRVLGVQLAAAQPGLLKLLPDQLPAGTDEQAVPMLSDFHYTKLALTASTAAPMVLALEGGNPMMGNQAVQLQVNFGMGPLAVINGALGTPAQPSLHAPQPAAASVPVPGLASR